MQTVFNYGGEAANSPLPLLEHAPSPSQPSSPFSEPCCQHSARDNLSPKAGQGCRSAGRVARRSQKGAEPCREVEESEWPCHRAGEIIFAISLGEKKPGRRCWLQATTSLFADISEMVRVGRGCCCCSICSFWPWSSLPAEGPSTELLAQSAVLLARFLLTKPKGQKLCNSHGKTRMFKRKGCVWEINYEAHLNPVLASSVSPSQTMQKDATSPAPALASHRGSDIPLTLQGVAKPFATAWENNRIDMQGLGINSS